MRLLEHQAKRLLSTFGLAFSQPVLVTSPPAAAVAAAKISGATVLKAQLPFGGRAKAGAVRFALSPEEAASAAAELFALKPFGHEVASVSIEPRIAFSRELYAAVAWDTSEKMPVALLSKSGGIDIEAASPSAWHRRLVDPWLGLRGFEARELAVRAGLTGGAIVALANVLESLARAFLQCDARLLEINPLVETPSGQWIGLDAHVEIEEDALFRQKERLAPLGEAGTVLSARAQTPLEKEAARIDALDHRGVAGRVVEFDGDLALLIGGGGASLTVFDAIRRHGGRPANYCEIGGNPTEEKVAALAGLLLSKPGVRKMAVIMNVVNNTRADVIARGVLAGMQQAGREPSETLVVFRVPGSWEQEAKALLEAANVSALGRDVSLEGAAQLAVERMNHHAP